MRTKKIEHLGIPDSYFRQPQFLFHVNFSLTPHIGVDYYAAFLYVVQSQTIESPLEERLSFFQILGNSVTNTRLALIQLFKVTVLIMNHSSQQISRE